MAIKDRPLTHEERLVLINAPLGHYNIIPSAYPVGSQTYRFDPDRSSIKVAD